jgi:cell division protein FtsB
MKKRFWSANKIKITIAFAIFSFLFAIAVYNERGILGAIEVNRELAKIKSNIRFLESENKTLEEAIISYRLEDFQIEKIAREDLDLTKENEIVIKIIREKK